MLPPTPASDSNGPDGRIALIGDNAGSAFNLRIASWRNDNPRYRIDAVSLDRRIDRRCILRTVRHRAPNRINLSKQVWNLSAITCTARGQRRSEHLTGVGIDHDMKLSPRAALRWRPGAVAAVDAQPRAINKNIDRTDLARSVQLDLDILRTSRQRSVVGNTKT